MQPRKNLKGPGAGIIGAGVACLAIGTGVAFLAKSRQAVEP